MVRDNAYPTRFGRFRKASHIVDNWCKEVRLKDVGFFLHHHDDALESAAGINILLFQLPHHGAVFLQVLHENVVPDLDDFLSVIRGHVLLFRHAGIEFSGDVIKHLGVRSAGTVLPCAPPVRLFTRRSGRHEIDSLARDPRLSKETFPDLIGFIIPRRVGIPAKDGDIEAIRIKSQPFLF